MITAWFRRRFAWFIEPIAAALGRMGVTANALTITGCLLNIGVALIVASGRLQLGGILMVVASGFDAADGTLARQMGKPTKYGAFLDSVLDRVSESAMLLGIAWHHMTLGDNVAVTVAYVAIVGSLLVSYTRARAEGLGVDCKVGLMTRVERCILIVIGLLARQTLPLLWILAVGTVFTTLQRMWYVHKQTGSTPLDA